MKTVNEQLREKMEIGKEYYTCELKDMIETRAVDFSCVNVRTAARTLLKWEEVKIIRKDDLPV